MQWEFAVVAGLGPLCSFCAAGRSKRGLLHNGAYSMKAWNSEPGVHRPGNSARAQGSKGPSGGPRSGRSNYLPP